MSDRDHTKCAAHGCPMLGVMTNNTAGSSDWWCAMHFGKNATQLQAITAELHRMDWLANIILDVRKHYDTENWKTVYRAAQHDLAMHQRNDLKFDGTESVRHWLERLERALIEACRTKTGNLPFEKPAATAQEIAGLQKVEFQQFAEEC